ncbi:MAG: zf-HC2 domain-containing protein [Chitinophagaceae bacterium]|nr:MAG: zf-HC2 domain-containing protein [Chitinophagaceae bacterium]
MLSKVILTCRQVATLASDYLDCKLDKKISWQIRAHLILCANCHRFVRHLKITKQVAPHFVYHNPQGVDAEGILRKIKEKKPS